jgi:uncharacterized membrane protein YhdT
MGLYALLDVALSLVRCLCVLVSFAAGVEWSYGIAMILAGWILAGSILASSPKPTARFPNYFEASPAKLVIK